MTGAEWAGAFFGVLGALLVALQVRASGFGFLAYAMSSVCFMAFAIAGRHWGILAMNCIFLVLALLGFYRWLLVEERLRKRWSTLGWFE
jgi:hypothetical protein